MFIKILEKLDENWHEEGYECNSYVRRDFAPGTKLAETCGVGIRITMNPGEADEKGVFVHADNNKSIYFENGNGKTIECIYLEESRISYS